ncbi:MAG: secondary thiamine-phosphate synthase enzyme YjbQ [Planctomycetota bacterium]|jgi:secondary thiamine-phosphate synthase enzyme
MKTIQIQTHSRTDLVDITADVRDALAESGVSSGLATVFVPHTTAGVTINENADPSVVRDILMEMNKVIPFDDGYHHGEGNSAAHIKSSLFGPSLTLIVEGGRLQLGTWQGIYFCDFDGPRRRKVFVKCVSG